MVDILSELPNKCFYFCKHMISINSQGTVIRKSCKHVNIEDRFNTYKELKSAQIEDRYIPCNGLINKCILK